VTQLQIEDFNVKIDVDVITPSLLWDARFVEFERHIESQRIYEGMSAEERQAIVLRLKRAVGVMYDTIDDWLPDSLSLSDDGTCIRMEFNLVLNKVELDVERKNKATTFKLKEIRAELESMLEKDE
jgi:hypothetical protein